MLNTHLKKLLHQQGNENDNYDGIISHTSEWQIKKYENPSLVKMWNKRKFHVLLKGV